MQLRAAAEETAAVMQELEEERAAQQHNIDKVREDLAKKISLQEDQKRALSEKVKLLGQDRDETQR